MGHAEPVWDVALRRRLRHGDSRFTLDVRFSSLAPRVALLGPSGSGKTQTLRTLAGIVAPDAGHVRIAGRALADSAAGLALPAPERRLGCVFQDYALFPQLTVRQNVAFGLTRGWRSPPRAVREPAAEQWIERFGLGPVADHFPHQLSGGQRQRTALARALAPQPAALLLDEPFAALDRPLRQRLREELAELQAALALPMLLITHDDEDLRHLADTVVQMEAGRVVETRAAR